MSFHDYQVGQEIARQDYPFYALLQAVIRQADSDNYVRLRAEWPEVVNEVQDRYNAPGGHLEGEEN